MRQTTVIGVLSDEKDLNLHEGTRQGLHFARSVIILSAEDGQDLPQTGRGKAVAGADSGQIRLNRMIVCWGSDKEVAKLVRNADRPSVFGVVRGTSTHSKRAIKKLREQGSEAHLLVIKSGTAARIVGSDAAKPVIQWSTEDGWLAEAQIPSRAAGAQVDAPAPVEPPVEPAATQEPDTAA